jgi:hypothetical protein
MPRERSSPGRKSVLSSRERHDTVRNPPGLGREALPAVADSCARVEKLLPERHAGGGAHRVPRDSGRLVREPLLGSP